MTNTALTTLDASANSGGVTFTSALATGTTSTGGSGNDVLTGATGNDVLTGGAGNDTLTSQVVRTTSLVALETT